MPHIFAEASLGEFGRTKLVESGADLSELISVTIPYQADQQQSSPVR